jgi:hypothetical protein
VRATGPSGFGRPLLLRGSEFATKEFQTCIFLLPPLFMHL